MRIPLLALVLLLTPSCKKEEVVVAPTLPAVAPAPVHELPTEPVIRADAVTGGDNPNLQVRVGGAAAQPTLAFEIVKIYEGQQPSNKTPFHAGGGKWTYFDAKLADGTAFTVGLFDRLKLKSDPPMTLVDAALIAPSNDEGAKLALAYSKAFKTSKAPAAGKPAGLVPMKINSVNLGENVTRSPSGGFGGTGGTWVASKWTIERNGHAAEVYFNFSLAEKKGEWAQKDADYDVDVATDLMQVLHDGIDK